MTPLPPPTPAEIARSARLHARIRLVGLTLLAGGLLASALIYVFAGTEPDAASALANARLSEFNTARLGGMTTVYVARFNRWLATLWHGQSLAYTVATLSVVGALLCFWAADWIADPLPGEPPSRGRG
jgi:uncharacterized membrane protein